MKIHELKSWNDYFEDVINYSKGFELRQNDRGFVSGDYLLLKEWDTEISGGVATGREALCRVDSLLSAHEAPGLTEGYCIMGITFIEMACDDYDEAYLDRKPDPFLAGVNERPGTLV